jgi:hypothetical protein
VRSRRPPAGFGRAVRVSSPGDGSKAAVPANCSGNLPDQRFEPFLEAMFLGDHHGALLDGRRQPPPGLLEGVGGTDALHVVAHRGTEHPQPLDVEKMR